MTPSRLTAIQAMLIFFAGSISIPVSRFIGWIIVSYVNWQTMKHAFKRMERCGCAICGSDNFKYKYTRGYDLIKVKCFNCGNEVTARPKYLVKAWKSANKQNNQ